LKLLGRLGSELGIVITNIRHVVAESQHSLIYLSHLLLGFNPRRFKRLNRQLPPRQLALKLLVAAGGHRVQRRVQHVEPCSRSVDRVLPFQRVRDVLAQRVGALDDLLVPRHRTWRDRAFMLSHPRRSAHLHVALSFPTS
jgi:hypothetical protein